MENWKIILEWVSVVFGGITGLTAIVFAIARIFGRNLIDEWFARRNKKYQAQLDKDLAAYKSILDSRIEVLKISYGNVFSERMSIFKEACIRMQKIRASSFLMSMRKSTNTIHLLRKTLSVNTLQQNIRVCCTSVLFQTLLKLIWHSTVV